MTYNETAAVVFRIVSAYPFYSRNITDEMLKDMVREWHEGLAMLPPDGVMKAVTELITEQKWMPSLSEVIGKILDIQYGTEEAIIRKLDQAISRSSTCIIIGQVTDEQRRGYEELTNFQKLIVRSAYEFNLWMQKDYEWKEERVRSVKREIQYGRHADYLNGKQQKNIKFNVFKALEERKSSNEQQTQR